MPKTKDYYELLEVPRKATEKEIQSAFRRLARKYHPDMNPGDKDAEQRFKEISEAHDVLADPEKRKLYDQFGAQWQQAATAGAGAGAGPEAGWPGGSRVRYQNVQVDPEDLRDVFRNFSTGGEGNGGSFSDLFGSMFGRGRTRTAPEPPQEPETDFTVSFREAYTGTHRQVDLPDGRRVEVTVPAGVTDGTVLRVAGVRLRVHVSKDRTFEREGKNVRVAVQVPLTAALLGGEVEVPTPKGTKVTLTVPPETQNGTRLRLRGLGMPDTKGGKPGDLFAEVKVRLPLPLDERTRRWAQDLAEPDAADEAGAKGAKS
ncbi:MAG: J domain-containing protein [Candidatus Dormibacteraeota bacterium]|nr:J domain-containing protein [Candidatus Dormibacteraeota bacterium]MBO0703935.1 J domain-containing protein [Candidatus Dormibacteraeota bacterium]MBO0760095.1 J domain-containing protein [Candidatus Dormibacteraeota bacterium]